MKPEQIAYYQDLERRYPLSWQLRLAVLRRRAQREAEKGDLSKIDYSPFQYEDPDAPNFIHPPLP